MINGPTPSQRYIWSCPDCGKTGWSSTHHGAVVRLRAHWRGCPDPHNGGRGRPTPAETGPPVTPFYRHFRIENGTSAGSGAG